MKHPCLVFVNAALLMLTVLMSAFAAYHVFLAATNQTTNERYKKHRLKQMGKPVPSNIYSLGLAQNILQTVFPHSLYNIDQTSIKKFNKKS